MYVYRKPILTIHVPYTVLCVQQQFWDTNAIYDIRRNVSINVALFSYERGIFSFV
jgi:hypothetical protein